MRRIAGFAIILVILALVTAVTAEAGRSADHQDCSCCASHEQEVPGCHPAAKNSCVCNFQLTQVFAPSVNLFLKLCFAGVFEYEPVFLYSYQSSKDIFHPPKA